MLNEPTKQQPCGVSDQHTDTRSQTRTQVARYRRGFHASWGLSETTAPLNGGKPDDWEQAHLLRSSNYFKYRLSEVRSMPRAKGRWKRNQALNICINEMRAQPEHKWTTNMLAGCCHDVMKDSPSTRELGAWMLRDSRFRIQKPIDGRNWYRLQ